MAWVTVLGLPAAIYVASIIALLFQLQGMETSNYAVVGSGMLAMGIYVFHRTSVQQSSHMQPRHHLAIQHRLGLNMVAIVISLGAATVLAMHHPLAPLLLLGACVGVVFYGRRTLFTPLRHFRFVKPIAVGSSIVFLAWMLTGMPIEIVPAMALAVLCSADALLCDLEDRSYDTSTDCTTLASSLGNHRSWLVATCIYLGGGLALILLESQLLIGLLFLILFPVPLLFRETGIRTIIDLRPLLVLLLAWII